MFNKLHAIAYNTFIETVRQPIYNVLLWVAVGLLVINPAIAGFSLEHEGDIKIVKDVGLATLLLYGLLASVFSATSVITREIESHTVLTVVSKPVSRVIFLLGKYLGVCGAALVGYFLLAVVFLLSVRHGVLATAADKLDQPVLVFSLIALGVSVSAAVFGNYVYGWHFPATLLAWAVPLGTLALLGVLCVSKTWQLQSPATDFGDGQMVYAIAMCFSGLLILTAFAVALATRFSQVLTLLLCTVVYVLGLLSDHLFGRTSGEHPTLLAQLLYAIVPNFQFVWAGDALTQQRTILATHVANVAGYSVLYALAVLALGVLLFEEREVG